MIDSYLYYYCDHSLPTRQMLTLLAAELDDEWGELLREVLADPLMKLPEWLEPTERSVMGRIQYCLLSGDDIYPIP